MKENSPLNADTTRRDFLAASGSVLAAAAFAGIASSAYANSNDTLRVALVGCGGRGSGAAAQALNADPNVKLVAMADAFEDRLNAAHENLKNAAGDRVDVDADHRFVGLTSFKGAIDSGVDVVILASPPAFRPEHLAYAVEKGKHVFAEKPVAVDPAGVNSVLESARIAKEKNLCLGSGLCYRYEFAKRDTYKQILENNAIGDITAMQATYNTEGIWVRDRQQGWSDTEYHLRNWAYYTWLGGDIIVEQHIHSLDKLVWAMGDQFPVRCTASGSRHLRTGERYGHVYDNFSTVYEWENGVRGFTSSRHWPGSTTNVSDFAFGTKGTAALQGHYIEGENEWRHQPTGPDAMYQNQHNELFAAIRANEPFNDGELVAKGTLMAILGRDAAYTGRTIEWNDLLEQNYALVKPSAEYDWTDRETPPVPRPNNWPPETVA